MFFVLTKEKFYGEIVWKMDNDRQKEGCGHVKEFTIGKNDAGQRLDRWLAKTLPLLPAPLAQKYIRLKRVKVNGKGS